MKIKSIDIAQFGKLKNLHLDFSDGLQIIYGGNETGKSTIQSFLRVMLYGMPNRKEDGLRVREKILPWPGGKACGTAAIENGSRAFEVQRSFDTTARGDTLAVTDSISGSTVPELSADPVGQKLLGISRQTFEKTCWIRQGGMAISGREEELSAKLSNLVQTGEEEISAARALERLEAEKHKWKAKDRRSLPGVLDRLEEQKLELMQEKEAGKAAREEYFRLETRLNQVMAEYRAVKAQAETAENARRKRNLQAMIDDAKRLEYYQNRLVTLSKTPEFRRYANIPLQEHEQLEHVYSRWQAAEHSYRIFLQQFAEENINHTTGDAGSEAPAQNRARRKGAILGAVLMGAGAAGMVLSFVFGKYLLIFGILVAIGSFLWFNNRRERTIFPHWQTEKPREQKEGGAALRVFPEEKAARETELEALRQEVARRLEQFGVKEMDEYRRAYQRFLSVAAEMRTIRHTYEELLDGRNAADIAKKAVEAERQLAGLREVPSEADGGFSPEALRAKETLLSEEQSELRHRLKYEFQTVRPLADIIGELEQTDTDIREGNLHLRALETAEQTVRDAYSQVRAGVGARLNQKAEEIYSALTDGSPYRIRVSEDYRLKVLCGTEWKEAEFLSSGAYEQLYFSLRMALAELVCPAGCPVFLDDSFAFTDDFRTGNALEYLKKLSEHRQVFLFTCQGRELQYAKRNQIPYINLEEEIV